MLDPQLRIAFIGGGNMAKAIIRGLLKYGHDRQKILVCAPTQATRCAIVDDFNVRVHPDNTAAVAFADVIVLAVKPSVIARVCDEINTVMGALSEQKLVISIAAGVKQATLRRQLGKSQRVICAMPNLPAAVGKGLTGLYASPDCDALDTKIADSLMKAVGNTVWLEDESLMPSIVAVAGSSPAYFFLFMEAMAKAGVAQGLSSDTANKAVLQSALGAISMAIASQQNLADLRRQVTSPKGTTEQGINTFLQGDLDSLVTQAMRAVANRAEQLAQEQ